MGNIGGNPVKCVFRSKKTCPVLYILQTFFDQLGDIFAICNSFFKNPLKNSRVHVFLIAQGNMLLHDNILHKSIIRKHMSTCMEVFSALVMSSSNENKSWFKLRMKSTEDYQYVFTKV